MCKALSNLSARTVDILLLSVVLLGFISNTYGLNKIDWRITYEKYHVFFCLSCAFLAVTFMYCGLMLYFRINNTINTTYNRSVNYIIYFLSFINAVGLILTLVTFVNTTTGLSSPDGPIQNYKTKLFVKEQWSYIFVSMSFVSIFYVLQFPLWYSALKRIELKTNGSLKTGDFVIVSI